MVKWLVVKASMLDDDKALEEALQRNNIEHKIISVKDVYLDSIPYGDDDEVFLFAPILSTQMLTRKFKWLNWAPFDRLKCNTYYWYFRPFITQQSHVFAPAGMLHENWYKVKEDVYGEHDRHFSSPDLLFVRPDNNTKRFVGEVVNRQEFGQTLNGIEPDVMCVAAEPQNFTKEWRVLMVNGEPITGSLYFPKEDRREEIPDPEQLKKWWKYAKEQGYEDLPSMIHFDVAESQGGDIFKGKLSLLEISAVNCAGLYQMSLDKFVTAVQAQAVKEYETDWSGALLGEPV